MLYEPVLVVHVIAAALLIGGGLLLAAAGFGLVSMRRGHAVLPWGRLALASSPMTVGAGVLLFASGGHLAGTQWSFSEGWITVSAAVLAVLGIATLVLYRRLWRLMEEVRDTGDAEITADLRARLASPGLWVIAHALVFSGPAFIAVMVLKTTFGATAAWLFGAVAVGAASGVWFSRWGSGARVAARQPAG